MGIMGKKTFLLFRLRNKWIFLWKLTACFVVLNHTCTKDRSLRKILLQLTISLNCNFNFNSLQFKVRTIQYKLSDQGRLSLLYSISLY